jgi:hypothetical protein
MSPKRTHFKLGLTSSPVCERCLEKESSVSHAIPSASMLAQQHHPNLTSNIGDDNADRAIAAGATDTRNTGIAAVKTTTTAAAAATTTTTTTNK